YWTGSTGKKAPADLCRRADPNYPAQIWMYCKPFLTWIVN
ncbi:uncharacterized protein METZ01_LOCUS208562, partial [marine metagenome]